jgi:hypothetical protein
MGLKPVLVQEQAQAQGDVGGELGVAVVGNVQVVGVGSGHIHQPSRMEGDHSFHIGSAEGEVHTWQADQVEEYDSGVKKVAVAVAAQFARTSSCHDGRTVCYQMMVGSGMSG